MIERDMDVILLKKKKYSRIICNQINIKSKLARKKVVICCNGNIYKQVEITVIRTRGQNICLFSSYFSVVSNCITL